jgi:hypothetical protein
MSDRTMDEIVEDELAHFKKECTFEYAKMEAIFGAAPGQYMLNFIF